MSFPWTTVAEARKQQAQEDFARRECLKFSLTMADILEEQRKVNVLRPATHRTGLTALQECDGGGK